jgi:hypothetical protein
MFTVPGTSFAFDAQREEIQMERATQLMTESIRSRPLESEEMLLLAVLEQAIADLDDTCPAVRADALAYMFSYGDDYGVFSFDSVCTYFKLSPGAVRQALRVRLKHAAAASPAYETAA